MQLSHRYHKYATCSHIALYSLTYETKLDESKRAVAGI